MATAALQDLQSQIARYKPEVTSYLQHGFKVAGRLGARDRSALVSEMVTSLQKGNRKIEGVSLENNGDFSKSERGQIVAVYTVTMGLLGENEATVDDFLTAGRDKLFDANDEASAREVAAALCEVRSTLKSSIASVELAGRVLPSFSGLELQLDYRLQFSGDQLLGKVPVVVAYLNTDARDHRVWFQMTRGDIENVIEKLSGMLADIEKADKLLQTIK